MADPQNQLCKNCFRCVSECPQRALIMSPGPEYRELGSGIWSPLRISTIWDESETGKIPVFGAGYRGMFAGPGFDGMWTDMSEIVRPTRDGIHGREFISTGVDIGSKPAFLEFDKDGSVTSKDSHALLNLPIPVVMDVSRLRVLHGNMMSGYMRAAKHLDTLLMASPALLPQDLPEDERTRFVPVYTEAADIGTLELRKGVRMVEVQMTPQWKKDVRKFKERFPGIILALRMNAGVEADKLLPDLVDAKVDVAHLVFDEQGLELMEEKRHSKDSLRAAHRSLVSRKIRDQITIITGGGIAAAEHVPKSIICGADAVALEKALLIALECRDCPSCSKESCPINLHDAPIDWIEGRVLNMVGAWRDQLLEVLGAMGLREVRRLRGELGRAIFFEDVEREAFGELNGGELDG
jgi:ferredoxin